MILFWALLQNTTLPTGLVRKDSSYTIEMAKTSSYTITMNKEASTR